VAGGQGQALRPPFLPSSFSLFPFRDRRRFFRTRHARVSVPHGSGQAPPKLGAPEKGLLLLLAEVPGKSPPAPPAITPLALLPGSCSPAPSARWLLLLLLHKLLLLLILGVSAICMWFKPKSMFILQVSGSNGALRNFHPETPGARRSRSGVRSNGRGWCGSTGPWCWTRSPKRTLEPHGAQTWWGKPTDPEFEPKMLEIVGLPPDRSPKRTRAAQVPNDRLLS
jgi:hypothetical protein